MQWNTAGGNASRSNECNGTQRVAMEGSEREAVQAIAMNAMEHSGWQWKAGGGSASHSNECNGTHRVAMHSNGCNGSQWVAMEGSGWQCIAMNAMEHRRWQWKTAGDSA